MCVALTMIGEDEDINEESNTNEDTSDEKDEPQKKFSYQAAWVIIKPGRSGHIVKINCRGKSQTYLSRETGANNSNTASKSILKFLKILSICSKKNILKPVTSPILVKR